MGMGPIVKIKLLERIDIEVEDFAILCLFFTHVQVVGCIGALVTE